MAIELGVAYVSVVPSAKGLQANLAREFAPLGGMAAQEGQKAGKAFGGQFSHVVAGEIVGERLGQQGRDAGRQVGGQFTQGVSAEVVGGGLAARMAREGKNVGASFQRGLSSAGIAGGVGAAFLVKASVDAASDLAESQSKVNVVFKDGARDVEDWSKSSSTALGISQQAALEAAGTFGNFLISMGLIPGEAQKMSVSMVGLAADLASFNNTSPEEALLAIRAGLAGEIEPLRRYGVALSAARVEQEAHAQGIDKSNAEMSAAEKATFAYQIILKDTALAQGDFARTSDGLANQQRILAARLKNAQAELGAKLIPLLLAGADAAVALGHGLTVVNKATGGWAGTLGGAAVVGAGVFLAVTKISSGLGRLVDLFKAQEVVTQTLTAAQATNAGSATVAAAAQGRLAVSSGAAAVAMEAEAVSAGVLSTRLKLLPSLLAAVGIGFIGGKKAGDELNKFVTGSTPSVDEFTASLLRLKKGQTEAFDFKGLGADFKDQITRSGSLFKLPVEFGQGFVDAFTGGGAHRAKEQLGPLNDALKEVLQTQGVDAANLAYGRLFRGLRDEGVSVEVLTRNFHPFTVALGLAQAKEEGVSTATKGLTGDLKGLTTALEKRSATLGIADQLDAAQTAVDDLTQLKLDAAGKGQRSIDAARNERQAQDSLSDAYDAQGDAAESLLDAKRNLAEFDSANDRRIRTLEREQITSRIVTTPEDARQKEIDLLKFDDDAIDRREQLQKQVASATDSVTAAVDRVGDAEEAVSLAAAARRQVQVDAAEGIRAAERRAEEAVLAAASAVLKAKDDQLIGNDALAAYLTLLDGMQGRLDPGSPLSKNLDAFLEKLRLSELIAGSIGPAGPQGFAPPPFQLPPLGIAFPSNLPPPTAPAKPNVTVNTTNNVTAPDQPSRQTLDTLNRKQALRLAASGAFR